MAKHDSSSSDIDHVYDLSYLEVFCITEELHASFKSFKKTYSNIKKIFVSLDKGYKIVLHDLKELRDS